MPDTDGPLKRLLETSAADFAEWLLGAEVLEIQAVLACYHSLAKHTSQSQIL